MRNVSVKLEEVPSESGELLIRLSFNSLEDGEETLHYEEYLHDCSPRADEINEAFTVFCSMIEPEPEELH